MDNHERAQIRLILEHLSSESIRKSSDDQKAMFARHAANGLLRSGATVKAAVAIVEEHASKFVSASVDQVSDVAKDVEAYAAITASLTTAFRGWQTQVDQATNMATMTSGSRADSVKVAATTLFADTRSRVFNELEIHRFSFTRPSKGDMAQSFTGLGLSPMLSSGKTGPEAANPQPRNVGGKALAPHWDQMWADIAIKLWTGDLVPKRQADISEAMFAWFNGKEINVGQTAVTERARALWLKIEPLL